MGKFDDALDILSMIQNPINPRRMGRTGDNRLSRANIYILRILCGYTFNRALTVSGMLYI